MLANTQSAAERTRIAPRPYPLIYNNPSTALAITGATVRLPHDHNAISATCELGLVIGRPAKNIAPDAVREYLRGCVTMLALRDGAFAESLTLPHTLPANMTEIYARWPDGYNVVSAPAPLPATFAGRAMQVSVASASAKATTDDYLLDVRTIVAELSRGITLLPGDIIALGETAATLLVPSTEAGALQIRAEIEGLAEVTATLLPA